MPTNEDLELAKQILSAHFLETASPQVSPLLKLHEIFALATDGKVPRDRIRQAYGISEEELKAVERFGLDMGLAGHWSALRGRTK